MGRNIVVIGETGTGKSSIINILTGREEATVSSSASGCTFETVGYPTPQGDTVYDTVGLDENTKGNLTPKKAIAALAKFLKNLHGGVNLILLVIKKGRVTQTTERNYDLFVNGICKGKVPVILIVTHCETTDNLFQWVNANAPYLRQIGAFDDIIPACGTLWTPEFHPVLKPCMNQAYEITKDLLNEKLAQEKYQVSHSFGTWQTWLQTSIRPVWDSISKLFMWPAETQFSYEVEATLKEDSEYEVYRKRGDEDVSHPYRIGQEPELRRYALSSNPSSSSSFSCVPTGHRNSPHRDRLNKPSVAKQSRLMCLITSCIF